MLTAGSADTGEAAGGGGGRPGGGGRGWGADREERTELPRGLEMKEPNPERGDNSFVNRTRQLNPALHTCTIS